MDALKEKSKKDQCVLVSAKVMNFLIQMETASLVELTKSSPMDNASALLDM